MNRRLELFSVGLFALSVGVAGEGVTSSLADEAGIEARVGI
jgi:alcohol dehydrogenase (cytochrome c)